MGNMITNAKSEVITVMKQPNGLDSNIDFFTLLGSEYIITLHKKKYLPFS